MNLTVLPENPRRADKNKLVGLPSWRKCLENGNKTTQN